MAKLLDGQRRDAGKAHLANLSLLDSTAEPTPQQLMGYREALAKVHYVGLRRSQSLHWWVIVKLHDYCFSTNARDRRTATTMIKVFKAQRRKQS